MTFETWRCVCGATIHAQVDEAVPRCFACGGAFHRQTLEDMPSTADIVRERQRQAAQEPGWDGTGAPTDVWP